MIKRLRLGVILLFTVLGLSHVSPTIAQTNDGQVTNVADLANKKIGINALNNIDSLAIQVFLSKHGVSPNSVKFR
jgi:ABC-type nitrate/sulfonate/bicarbonate transport system substrate-binding protein